MHSMSHETQRPSLSEQFAQSYQAANLKAELNEALKHEDAANRLYQNALTDIGRIQRERDEALAKRDEWANKAIEIAKERDRLRTANTDILVMLDGARTERDRAQADIPAHVDKIKRLSAELIQTVADGNQLRVDRDEANAEADRFAKIAGAANTARYAAEGERDKAVCDLMDRNNELLEARLQFNKVKGELFDALKERNEARSEREAAKKLLLQRGNDLLAARQEHPAGRIEALEARVAKLERIGTAR